MKVQKKDGTFEAWIDSKVINACNKANSNPSVEEKDKLSEKDIQWVLEKTKSRLSNASIVTVNDIHDIVEQLLTKKSYPVGHAYITFRAQKQKSDKFSPIEKNFINLVQNKNEALRGDNANKKTTLNSSQRDYGTGLICKSILQKTLPKDIQFAHDKGYIHFHDSDYFGQILSNCGLVNVEDMIENGFAMSNELVETPATFKTFCNLLAQINQHISGSQYGGQTVSWAHALKVMPSTKLHIAHDIVQNELIRHDIEISFKEIEGNTPKECYDNYLTEYISYDVFKKLLKKGVKEEIRFGIKTYQWQVLSQMSSNGQTPFVSNVLNLREAQNEEELEDLAMIIEEMIKRRIKGIKDTNGHMSTPLFPKLLYWLCPGLNMKEGDPYYYLTELAGDCVVKRMAPDFNSEKKCREIKSGQIIPSMGAVAGNEIVSIMIDGIEYNNIQVSEAIELLQKANKDFGSQQNPKDTELKGVCGVYKITYLPTGNYYIGSSKNIKRRFQEHRYSIAHTGAIEGNIIGDMDARNYKFELVKETSIDDMFDEEVKAIDLNDPLIINEIAGPRNPGSPNGSNHLDGTYRTRQVPYTKFYNCKKHCFIKSKGKWEPIEMFEINEKDVPLDIYDVTFKFGDSEKIIRITEDHPLHTNRGRVQCADLKLGDVLYNSSDFSECPITKIQKVDEKIMTYDFTTSNDMFDLSGIISHNCRSLLSPLWEDKTYPIDTKFYWQEITEDNVQYPDAYDKNFDYAKGFGTYSSIPLDKHVVLNFRGNSGWVISHDKYTITIREPKVYGRWNMGVVTINIPHVALTAKQLAEQNNTDIMKEFYKLFDERLEICHRALRFRWDNIKNGKAMASPILWQWGAYDRVTEETTLDEIHSNHPGRSSISLGFCGLAEAVLALCGHDNTTEEGQILAQEILSYMNKVCDSWKEEDETELKDEEFEIEM